ncbi:MAG: tetratricopeptide repeat protein [Planctomycetaceae bacterium]
MDTTFDRPSDGERAQLAEAKWHANLGNDHIARKAYNSVLRRNAGSAEAIVGMARLDQAAGRLEEAEQGYRVGLALKPNDPAILSAVSQYYISQERWHDARVSLQKAIEVDPADPALKHHMAVTLAKSGQEQLAFEYFKTSAGEPEAHYNLALIQYDQGDIVDCERHLLQAVLLKPDFPEAEAWLIEAREERMQRNLLEPRLESIPADALLAKPQPEAVVTAVSESAQSEAVPALAMSHVAPAAASNIDTDSNTPFVTSRKAEQLVLNSHTLREERSSSSVTKSNDALARSIGTTAPPLVNAPVETLSNAGGLPRNAQPPRPLRKVISSSQQEQWQNQLRMQQANR